MRVRTWQFFTALLTLALLTACGGSSSSSNPNAQITIQAQFEKPTLTPTGFGAITVLPARYCYAEVYDVASGGLLASGYLGSGGTGTAYVPRGLQVYVNVYTEYQVPCADPNSFFMRGRVKNAPLYTSRYISATDFGNYSDWYVTSASFLANQDGTVSVTALASNRIAGAFNIADQAVTFASAVRDMDGTGTLRLPNLNTFWTTSTNPADHQARTYPGVTLASATSILTSSSGRALFSHQVYGQGSGAANTETDEWDDGVLQETFAHLLFADYSYKPDGSSPLSLLRRDNDNAVNVSRTTPSESTAAFVAGFSDFLSCAARNNSQILDSYVDASGIAQVDDFDLASHAMVANANKGEFTRGSIAVSLWGMWKNALGGGQGGLQTLWQAVTSGNPGEYEQATLGCYPSYLLGVQSRVSAPTWSAALNELALESVPNPTPAYFAVTALWRAVGDPFSGTGTLQTYDASQARTYDQDQSQAYRFTQSASGTRTITMTPTGGQDFYLELLGPGGLVDGSYNNPGSPRTLTFTNLPVGVYAVRVRASWSDTATGTYGYTISIN